MAKKLEHEYSEEEIARRRDGLAKQMLNTPPQPLKLHSAMKAGKRKAEVGKGESAEKAGRPKKD